MAMQANVLLDGLSLQRVRDKSMGRMEKFTVMSKHHHQYHRTTLGNFFIWFHGDFKF